MLDNRKGIASRYCSALSAKALTLMWNVEFWGSFLMSKLKFDTSR
jgi:hypothetical protein